MTDRELEELLDEFRSLPSETEWLEFKEAKNNFDFNNLGKYFSTLSNEANLKEKQDMLKKFLIKFKQAGREDIDKLLMDKLPDHLNANQKKYKINNLLNEMANKTGVIKNKGSRARPVWVLMEND